MIRCSREIRSLTNELHQMKRVLEILRWFVAGVIILLSLLFIWMIRTRRSQSNGRTDSTSGTSVETISAQSSPTDPPVMSPRVGSSQSLCPCFKRRSVSVCTNSEVSTPRECDSNSASRGPVAVLPQKPSVVAWFQRCFCVPHLFGLPSSRKVDSSNRNCRKWFRRGGQNCKDHKDDVLVPADVGKTFCLDRAVHVPHGADPV